MFTFISVQNKAKKSGISVSKAVVEEAVRKVTDFLRVGKADLVGEFTCKSKTAQTRPKGRNEVEPTFWQSVINADSESTTGRCLVMSLSGENSEYYQCDLLLSSEDLNSCYFHKNLGKSLVKESTVIYVEVDKLTIRGSERLLVMLRDLKKLFDNRVKVLIINSSKTLSEEISKLIDIDISWTGNYSSVNLEPPPLKKLKSKHAEESDELREIKTLMRKQEVILLEKEKNEAKLERDNVELTERMAKYKMNAEEEYEKVSDQLRETKTDIHNLEVTLQEKEKKINKLHSEKKESVEKLAQFESKSEDEYSKVLEELRDTKVSFHKLESDSKLVVQKLQTLQQEREKIEAQVESDKNELMVKLAEVEDNLEREVKTN